MKQYLQQQQAMMAGSRLHTSRERGRGRGRRKQTLLLERKQVNVKKER